MHIKTIFILILALLPFSVFAQLKTNYSGKIDPNPNCGGSDLCVDWKQDGIARAEYRSEFFYLVVLKTAEKCRASEKERAQFQKIFPRNKVFLEQSMCGNDEEKLSMYDRIGDSLHSFIAVYAGKTKAEADRFYKTVKLSGRFPGANVRKTQVVLTGT